MAFISTSRLTVLLLLFFLHAVYAEEKACTVRDGDKYYDLSQLSASKDYVSKASDGSEYYVNVCRRVTTETWAIEDEKDVAIFKRTTEERGDFSLGSVNTTLAIHGGNPLLYLTNGSPCPTVSQLRAASVIRYICDTSVFAAGQPELIAELPGCSFFFEWRTHYACPTNSNSGTGGAVVVLGTIALILLMLYIVGGTLYNRYVLNLRGFDQLPGISLFSLTDTLELCNRIVDRIMPRPAPYGTSFNHQHHAWNTGPRSGNRPRTGYERLTASDEERQGMLNEEDDDDHTPVQADTGVEPSPEHPTESA
ncbi:mannose 6-phosphate receptor domain-containing protein [Neolentinus lepideus HHB14362 ss-1]|uniref:Mannose 6-phosphate receptor domain-containing protein n=1 Tax=Neolentinus lepideus HHB14362 ss-1 TaxID=1314782 RepID=A0A165WCJ7_9AGAM|nr:mannose 6-phosphate receptor domain-containing protein [Neolentinus lepideus HHB14362 ss-1]